MDNTVLAALGLVAAAVLGLACGSAARLAAARLAHGRPMSGGGARCAACRRSVAAHTTLPLLRWFGGGRCPHCGAPAGARHPWLELITAALVTAVAWRADTVPAGVLLGALAVGLVVISAVDLDAGLIPDAMLLVLAPLGLVYQLLVGDLVAALAGGALAGGVAYALRAGYRRLRGADALGLGDVKFFAVAGLWLGPFALPAFMIVAGIAGSAFALIWRRLGGGREFPFGPALSFALLACLLVPGLADIFA